MSWLLRVNSGDIDPGIPGDVDQDRVFLVSENSGELILTEKFRAYTKTCRFKLHFCRKAYPESKGKIENVVKYVKQNFLYNRALTDIDTLNQEVLAWLGRTANHMPHSTTRKQPSAEWEIEKKYLQPYQPTVNTNDTPLDYTVRKDNSIAYRGNFYSLPLGTYTGKGCKVGLVAEQDKLLIYNQQGVLLCAHQPSLTKGQKIINNDHKREKAAGIKSLMDQVCKGLEHPEQGLLLLEAIRSEKPRYIRDQVLLLKKAIETYPPNVIAKALSYCLSNTLYSAADLKSIAAHLHQQEIIPAGKVVQMNPLNGTMPSAAFIQPATSAIEDYNMF